VSIRSTQYDHAGCGHAHGRASTSEPQPYDGGARAAISHARHPTGIHDGIHAGGRASPAVVVIDNYDSFTPTVVHALELAGARCSWASHDDDAVGLVARDADGYLISAGPCTPDEAGASVPLVALLARERPRTPLFGLCLGHQALARAGGARLRRATRPWHGKLTAVRHDDRGLFAGLPQPLAVARYNSLVVDEDSLPPALVVSARDEDGDVMGLRHRDLPHEGVQFHPESWLCPAASAILSRWVEACRSWRRLAEGAPVGQAP
jgi:anthranilate synthase/aminodeoxychorismate synthase-like glutamine amidotransferase